MTYTPYHDPWEDYPDTSTPITAAALNHIEAGIVDNVGPEGPTGPTGPAGTGGASIDEYQITGSTVVGGTSLTIDRVGSAPIKIGAIICVSAYTTRAELKTITGVAGTTITVSAMRTAHTANDLLLVIESGVIPTNLYGVAADGSDDWAPLQRCVLEATQLGGLVIDGQNRTHYVGKPLLFSTSSHTTRLIVQSRTGFSPVESSGAMVMVGSVAVPVAASAATNVFTTTGSHSMNSYSVTNHSLTVIVNPYGETMPGGVTAGGVYYINTVPSATTFTVSATSGGAILDVTQDGTGWVFTQVGDLCRVFWDSPRFNLTIDGLNGVLMGLQQPSWTRNLRVEMDAAATVSAVGCTLLGQLSYHDNIEVNTSANCVGMAVSGSGHIIRGFNCNGVVANDTALTLNGRCHSVSDIWTEQCGRAGVELTQRCRGIALGGTWLMSVATPTSPALLVSHQETSYTLNQIRTSNASSLLISDVARGIEIVSWNGFDTGDTDNGLVFGGMRQEYGSIGPILRDRTTRNITATYAIRRTDGNVLCDPSSGSFTATLPTAAGWGNLQITVVHASASGNTVSVDASGAETINGSGSPVVLNSYERITVTSNGTNWIRVD